MDINTLIEQLMEVADDSEMRISPETTIEELGDSYSLIALSIMMMIAEEYDVMLTADDLKTVNTVEDLFNLVKTKKQ